MLAAAVSTAPGRAVAAAWAVGAGVCVAVDGVVDPAQAITPEKTAAPQGARTAAMSQRPARSVIAAVVFGAVVFGAVVFGAVVFGAVVFGAVVFAAVVLAG